MSSNLESFLYKFSRLDRCLCPLFKKQRRPSVPVKLCTVKVNIFFIMLFFFICKVSFANMYFRTHV